MTESSSRVIIKQDARECMSESLNTIGINVIEVQIRNIQPPARVIEAIEQKEAVEREVEQKRAELEKEELEAERKRIEAQGIRDSQEIIDETLTPAYIQYLWITEGIERGDTIYVVPSDGTGQLQLTKEVVDGNANDEEDESNSSDSGGN